MATPESKRQAPDRELDNYVAHIKRLIKGTQPPGIEDDKFLQPNFISDGTTLIPASASSIPLGFNVKINGVTYSEIHISGYGFVVLQEPGAGFTMTDISTSSDEFRNELLKPSYNSQHIVIAPWWDECGVPVKDIDTLSTIGSYTTLTPQMIQDIKFGKDTKNWPFHPYDRGVRYKKIYDYTEGVGIAIRWTNLFSLLQVLKFETCIFENGKIQFKYWPIEKFENAPSPPISVDTRSATVGVFWSGNISVTAVYKFRDFAPLLDYQKDIRIINELGGASPQPGYVDGTTVYSNRIKTNLWPGPAIISFDPPKNPGKFLPRKNSVFIASNKQLLSKGGFFDDRKTFNFVSDGKNVHMPSLLPNRLVGDTSPFINVDTRQLLFTNGSITAVTGTTVKSVIDSQVEMLDALDSIKKIESDYSFNEFKQNYSVTESTSSFYTNEDSVEKYGEGFTYPLKSKTKFIVTLPVEKQVKMPPENSSFYWYDKERKSWNNVGETAKIPDTYINYEVLSNNPIDYTGESDRFKYLRIAETAVGFDAIGQKIVSGSIKENNQLSQKSLGLGVAVNYIGTSPYKPISNEKVKIGKNEPKTNIDTSMGVEVHANSITDSPTFFPAESQRFKLGNEYPFLIEKIVVTIPIKATGDWFKDVTTCNKPFVLRDIPSSGPSNLNGYVSKLKGKFIGPIDFGGPAITFAVHSAKKGGGNKNYLDLIASGTITHSFDNKAEVHIQNDIAAGQDDYTWMIRPTGFLSFSKPTAVINPQLDPTSGIYNYEDEIKLELESSVSSGVTLAKNVLADTKVTQSGIENILKSEFVDPYITTLGLDVLNYEPDENNPLGPSYNGHLLRDNLPIYIQQMSPHSRGTSRIEFNGHSILGPTMATYDQEKVVKNNLFDLSTYSIVKAFLDTPAASDTTSELVTCYTLVDTRPSPYLLMPGETLSVSISKTKPVLHTLTYKEPYDIINYESYLFSDYQVSGSHESVFLNTGSINLTFYGSYISEGFEYHT